MKYQSQCLKPSRFFGFAEKEKETLKPLEASSATAESGFVFGASSDLSFSALAASGSGTGFTKPSGDNPWGGYQSSSFFTAFSKTGATNSATQNEGPTEAGGAEEVAPSNDIHFEPVIPLPELVTVQTGEEQDEVLFSQRAKLYVFHAETSEWKERALGEAKILRCTDGRARILVRRETVSCPIEIHVVDSEVLLSSLLHSVTL